MQNAAAYVILSGVLGILSSHHNLMSGTQNTVFC